MITAKKLHRFIVNPLIPPKFACESDWILEQVTKEYQRWLVQDQMLFIWLLSSLSEAFLPRVLGCKHSWEIWDKVHKHFYSTMKAKVRQLKTELKTTKKGTRTISEYILLIKSIFDSLVANGDYVTEQDQINAILEGLPEEYGLFVMMIYGCSDSPSVVDIESLLLLQEAQLENFKNELTAGNNVVSVHVAQGPLTSNTNSDDSENNTSNSGGKVWRGGRGSKNNRGKGRYGSCMRPMYQLCFKYGHDAFNCWNRFDENFV